VLPPFRQLQKGEPQKGSIPLQWWLQGGWAGRPTQLPGSPYSCAGTGGLTGLGWEAYEAGVGGGQRWHHVHWHVVRNIERKKSNRQL